MPVPVSLLKLVQLDNSRPLWPEEFEALIAKLEESLNDRTHYGVIADWLREQNEHELADAFAWVSKRTEVKVAKSFNYAGGASLIAVNCPSSLGMDQVRRGTIPFLMATLAERLSRERERAKREIEELA